MSRSSGTFQELPNKLKIVIFQKSSAEMFLKKYATQSLKYYLSNLIHCSFLKDYLQKSTEISQCSQSEQ